MLQTALEPGYPMWDEIAAMVWLAPEIVTRADTLYVDFETSQTAAYGDTLSWADAWRPNLGEQAQRVILTVDRARMEAAMRALYRRPVRHWTQRSVQEVQASSQRRLMRMTAMLRFGVNSGTHGIAAGGMSYP